MEMFLTGGLVGVNMHLLSLALMRKSCSHHFNKLFKTCLFYSAFFWYFGVVRKNEAKKLKKEALKENITNRI